MVTLGDVMLIITFAYGLGLGLGFVWGRYVR